MAFSNFTGVLRALCHHCVIVGQEDAVVVGCDSCAIAESIRIGRVSPTARFVTYEGSLTEHHGLYHVVRAEYGRLYLVEVAPEKDAEDLVCLRNAGFASVVDVGYAGRYEAVEVAEAAEAFA